jgi:predicted amidohydrolase YtcJ
MTGEVLLSNGRFFTDGGPSFDAVAIGGGRIIATGSRAEAKESLSSRAETVDLGGAYVTPGLSDGHAHVLNYGRSRMGVPCWPSDVDSVSDIVALIRAADAKLAPDKWVRGRGYDPGKLSEQRAPTAAELDLPSGRPVVLDSFDFHRRVANHAAIAAAGIVQGQPDPPGGHIVRDGAGEPTGEFLDAGRGLLDPAIPPWSREEDRQAVEIAAERWLGMGFTAVTNAAPLTMSRWGEEVEAFLRAAQSSELPIRVRTMIRRELLEAADAMGLLPGVGDDRLRIIGLKAFADGAIGPRTAALWEPYVSGGLGDLALEGPEIEELAETAARRGWRLCIHAIGDRAVTTVAEALAAHPAEHPHRIEHCQMTDQRAVAAMASSRTIPVPQLAFLRQRSEAFAAACGDERTARMYPLRTWIDAGLRPIHSSDSPVIPDPRPMPALATAVTRADENGRVWGAEEGISVSEGIRMMTSWAAEADGESATRGRIAPGYLGDLTVLGEDPHRVPANDIASIPVLMTIVGGVVRRIVE